MRKTIGLILLSVCLTGCNIYDIDDILLQKEVISLTVKGEDIIVYEPETYQEGHNAEKYEFRVFDDDMANWFVLTCDSRPSTVGQELRADLKWTSHDSNKTRKGLTFKVMKTAAGGYIWMWCETDAIGIVVREL